MHILGGILKVNFYNILVYYGQELIKRCNYAGRNALQNGDMRAQRE